MFTYPTALDELPPLTDIAGPFWTQIYGGNRLVNSYLKACISSRQQFQLNLEELQATVGRSTCPIFHTANWYAIVLSEESGVGLTNTERITEEDAVRITEDNQIRFTDSDALDLALSETENGLVYPVPVELAEIGYVADAITNPNLILTQGIDFELDPLAHTITFVSNPFLNPVLSPTINGDDRFLTLWAFKAQLDWSFLYQNFGYIFGLQLPSSQRYKEFIDAYLTAISGGTSSANIAALFAAMTDTSIIQTDGETVEAISSDASGLLIITDINVYRYPISATPTVAVGDVLKKGTFPVDTVQIIEDTQGLTPNLTSVTLDSSYLDGSISGPLTFNNTSTALVVTLNVSGFTKVSWALGGAGGDVTQFFNVLHTKGIAAGKTLAMMLDLRPQPQVTQPTAANLPTTINPMAFLFQNAFRANLFVVVVKIGQLGPNALGLGLTTHLRQLVPPGSNFLLVAE